MLTLLNIFSAIALLVWGTHIVRTGVLRVYGGALRKVLRHSGDHRLSAFMAGVGVTSVLQSSTATALLASSFVGQGLIVTAAALAVMLGADVGTAVMAQLFSLNLSWLSPILIVSGVAVYLSKRNERSGQIARIALGVGVMILALQLILQATGPIAQASGVKVLFSQLSGDPLLDLMIGAVFAVLCYSSLAVVLLTATMAASHLIPQPVALAVVLGANLGSGLLALLTTLTADPVVRRVPLANFIFKATGSMIALPLLPWIADGLALLSDSPQRLVVNMHLSFNIALAALFLPLTGRVAHWVERWLPASNKRESAGTPRHLDPVALATPALAIGCAAREAIRLADLVQDMLSGLLTVLRSNDFHLADSMRKKDDEIDQLYTAIKLYLTQVSREALDIGESKRWTDIIQFTINMEHAGDIIDRVLIDVAEKKIRHGLAFSNAGTAEIDHLHGRLADNLKLSVAVFLNGDLGAAQRLIQQKVQFRELEMLYADNHLHRLAGNASQSIETSSLHLDLLSDFKRINSLFCSTAYPILESAGVLSKSRVLSEAASLFTTNEATTT